MKKSIFKQIVFWLMVVILILSAAVVLIGLGKLLEQALMLGNCNAKDFLYTLAIVPLIISCGVINYIIEPRD